MVEERTGARQTLLQIAMRYQELAQNLIKRKDALPPEQVLECLISRNRIAHLLNKKGPAEPTVSHFIDLGDRQLRELTEPISQMVELTGWRQSFAPPAEAWWWPSPPPKQSTGFFARFDWLWTALALACLAVSLSLVTDISPRFLSGGPDTWGAFVVIAQSILALLTTRSILTMAGQDAAKRILSGLRFPRQFWEGFGLIISIFLLIFLLIFRFSLPRFARWYNNSGLDHYQQGQLTSAKFDYERALKLDPELLPAHYNLGLLYEDLNDLAKAKAEYQIAVEGGLDVAYNNLARLYILNEEYEKAIPFLVQGSKRAEGNEVRYSLYKNLAWARLKQGRYDEALVALQEAIKLASDKAPAHCLLAQVLEAQEKPQKEVDDAWEACLQYADSSRPDEDTWLGMARQYFSSQTEQQGDK
jgi:tetratricopeptide (TPR) repeat protein